MDVTHIESLIPQEVYMIVMATIAAWVIKPFLTPESGVWDKPFQKVFKDQRFIVIPFILGVIFGFIQEYTTPQFNLNVGIRRALFSGSGAALAESIGAIEYIKTILKDKILPVFFAKTP